MVLLQRLFSAEIGPLDERWRPWFTPYVAGFAVLYATTFLLTLHFVLLGPGLGDEFTLKYLLALLQQALALDSAQGTQCWFAAFMGLLLFSTAFRGWIVYRGYSEFRQGTGEEFPLHELLTFTLLNILNVLFVPAFLLLLAGAAAVLGYPPELGWQALLTIMATASDWVQRVPTLFTLSHWPAFAAALLTTSCLHYWMHRLSHTRRLLWLLFHRPHHMTPHLCYATTLPVYMAFPFFLLTALPYLFVFAAIGKLFSPEPLYAEMILVNLVIYIGEIYGHSPALYERAIKKRWVRWMGFLYCQGVYHVLHHSAARDVQRKANNNTVNIGLGIFCCWDILFGTFQPLPEKLPPIGLIGEPRLVMNPLRLLCAGVMQLVYELHANRSLSAWWNIMFGTSNYTPPQSRDFALHEQPASIMSEQTMKESQRQRMAV